MKPGSTAEKSMVIRQLDKLTLMHSFLNSNVKSMVTGMGGSQSSHQTLNTSVQGKEIHEDMSLRDPERSRR